MAEQNEVTIELTYEQRDFLVRSIEVLMFDLEEEGCRVYDKEKIEKLVWILKLS